MRTPWLALPVSLLLVLGGCKNSCQRICKRMASYAEECGHEVSTEEVRACERAQAGEASSDDRAVCRQLGDAATLREEWSCEDLEDYWSRAAPLDTAQPDSPW